MVAREIMDMARSRLGDKKKERWSDERLLTIVSQGQADICKVTGIYRQEAVLPLISGQTRYTLPQDCVTVKRVEYRGNKVPLHSRNDLDDKHFRFSEQFIALKDHLNMPFLDLYPDTPDDLAEDFDVRAGLNLEDSFEVVPIYGVGSEATEPYEIANPFGTVTEIESNKETYEPSTGYGELCDSSLHENLTIFYGSSVYGVTTEIVYPSQVAPDPKKIGFVVDSQIAQVKGKFGISTGIIHASSAIKIFYQAVPPRITTDFTALVIPEVWEAAMVRYVVGTELQDDNDANNIQSREREITKYTQEVAKARELGSKDFSSGTNDKLFTRHRRI